MSHPRPDLPLEFIAPVYYLRQMIERIIAIDTEVLGTQEPPYELLTQFAHLNQQQDSTDFNPTDVQNLLSNLSEQIPPNVFQQYAQHSRAFRDQYNLDLLDATVALKELFNVDEISTELLDSITELRNIRSEQDWHNQIGDLINPALNRDQVENLFVRLQLDRFLIRNISHEIIQNINHDPVELSSPTNNNPNSLPRIETTGAANLFAPHNCGAEQRLFDARHDDFPDNGSAGIGMAC